MVKNIIETFNIEKIYNLKGKRKKVIALKDINLKIKEHEKFGLLGPNCAGKTTMIKILTTLIRPTSGFAVIDGYNILKEPRKVREKLALMFGNQMLYKRVTGYSNLKFFCKMYNISNYKKKIEQISKEFELEGWLDQYVETYSKGMETKLALCKTLILDRKILFLDEPTSGLDIETRAFIVERLKNLNKTIFLTSHDTGVIENVCERIGFMNKGKIVKVGDLEDIIKFNQIDINLEIDINDKVKELKTELLQYEFIKDIIDKKKGLIISIKERQKYKDLLQILGKYNILKIKEQEGTLADLMLKIV